MPSRAFLFSALLSPVLVAGCATAPADASDIPPSLRPAGTRFLDVLAVGVQIYECAATPGQATPYAWTFRAPEATLIDRNARLVGKHFAGPTWESTDGSSVVGEVKSRDPGPDPNAIPWLLLDAKRTTGAGLFANTRSIQRVDTAGGIPPTAPCDASVAGRSARVPYSATYYFYR